MPRIQKKTLRFDLYVNLFLGSRVITFVTFTFDTSKQLLVNFGEKTLQNERQWLEKYKIDRKPDYSSRYNNNIHYFRVVATRFERCCRSTIPALLRENLQLYT